MSIALIHRYQNIAESPILNVDSSIISKSFDRVTNAITGNIWTANLADEYIVNINSVIVIGIFYNISDVSGYASSNILSYSLESAAHTAVSVYASGANENEWHQTRYSLFRQYGTKWMSDNSTSGKYYTFNNIQASFSLSTFGNIITFNAILGVQIFYISQL